MNQLQLYQTSAVFFALCAPVGLWLGWRLGWNAACDEQERLQISSTTSEGETVWP